MSARFEKIDSSAVGASLLEESAEGLFYVVDESANGLYEIEAFLGDVIPICQVYRAKFSTGQNIDEILRGRRGEEIHEDVALKLARIDDQSPGFANMREEVEKSFKIGETDAEENDVITKNNVILGIYKSFEYRGFFCVSMPYMREGSLRYIINSRIPGGILLPDEKCIAVVLRKVLDGLCFLHGREKVHTKLNAGNVFVDDLQGPVNIKLGYQGSNYFHDDRVDCPVKIWDDMLEPGLTEFFCVVSKCPENRFWTIQRIYEPNREDQNQNYTAESDIWNFGVTALEFAFGPLTEYRGRMRCPDELRTFLMNLRNNEEIGLPNLNALFISEDDEPTRERREEIDKKIAAVASVSTASRFTREEKKTKSVVSKMMQKVKAKFVLCVNPKPDEEGDEDQLSGEPKPDQLSSLFKEMVKKCLAVDPNERPTAQALLDDPFFKEHQNVNMEEYFAEWVLPYYPEYRIFSNSDLNSDSDSEVDW